MNRDTITGIVGAAILVAAMIGVFQYERTIGAARAGLGDDAQFQLANMTLTPATGSDAPGGDGWSDAYAITQGNLTMVTFTLTWTGGAPMSFSVTPPSGAGNISSADGSSGTLTISFPLTNPQPTDAMAGVLGTGDWALGVANMGEPPATSDVPVVGAPAEVSFNIAVSAQAWQPATTEA